MQPADATLDFPAPARRTPGEPAGRICFVTNEIDGLFKNGGIATYFSLAAHTLAEAGWEVHVLYTTPIDDAVARRTFPVALAARGITFHPLDAIPDPGSENGHEINRSAWFLERGQHIRCALGELHARYRFDLIEFAEYLGHGFRPIQAKRAGLDFQDVDFIVQTHSSSQWLRDGNFRWLDHTFDVQLDYCERYAFDHADVQLSPSRYMLNYLRSVGWNARPDALVSQLPFPRPSGPLSAAAPVAPAGPPELVFFGRLEARKGLEIFLDAVKGLPADVPVTFLGRDVVMADGRSAVAVIREKTAGRPNVTLLTEFGRDEALEYVTGPGRVAVMPSLADNLPYTVIEAIVNRVPFISSNVGGIPELVIDDEARARLLCEPTLKGLKACLEQYLKLPATEARRLHAAVSDAKPVPANHAHVAATYGCLAEAVRRKRADAAPAAAKDCPLVSIAVPYYNLGEFLPETLASLAAQTYPNLDVIVVDDGSTQAESLKVWEQMRALYPQFRFLTQPNGGIGAARNRGLAEAKGEFFIPVDADNIAHPRMVEVFVDAMRRRPDASSLASFHKAFRETPDIAAGKWRYFYRPTGGPHVLGPLENVFGDANSIHRIAAIRSVGGFELDRDTSWEDYELFAKLVNAGHVHDIIPDYLFFYRHREESWMRSTNEWKNHRRVMRQFFQPVPLGRADQAHLWVLLVGLNRKVCLLEQTLAHEKHTAHVLRTQLDLAQASRLYRAAHDLNRVVGSVPGAKLVLRKGARVLLAGPRLIRRTFRRAKVAAGLKLPAAR